MNGERESLVLHERPACTCGCGGGWDEPAARTHLGHVLAEVRLGIWERPQPPTALAEFGEHDGVIFYGDYAEGWLEKKVEGVIGEAPIGENTEKDYGNNLRHLRAFFGGIPVDEIDADLNLAYKERLLKESRRQREALEAGADLRDRWNRPRRPLSLRMISHILQTHKAILESAVETGSSTTTPPPESVCGSSRRSRSAPSSRWTSWPI